MGFADRYGPWAVVLGASEGTGREFARRIAAEGVPSILIARRTSPLVALAAEIRAESGIACETATIDLSQPDAFDRIVEAIGAREIGLFVCNAGGDPHGAPFLDRDLSAWRDLVQRNVLTMMECSHHLADPMRARGRGGILLVNSGACYGGASTMGPYSGSKAFMLCFAEGLWAELRTYGVDVLSLVLGRTDTPEFRRFLAEKNMPLPADAADAREVARIGLDRLAHGPVHNIGQADDQPGMFPLSAAARRRRVVAISRVVDTLYGRSGAA